MFIVVVRLIVTISFLNNMVHKNATFHGSFMREVVHLLVKSMIGTELLQGDSKRLSKVYVSISLIFFGPGDLKLCTEQLQNYTILIHQV